MILLYRKEDRVIHIYEIIYFTCKIILLLKKINSFRFQSKRILFLILIYSFKVKIFSSVAFIHHMLHFCQVLIMPLKCALRIPYFLFLSNLMGSDRSDSFPFDFEPHGIPFGSKSKGKLLPRSDPIQFERKQKYGFLSVLCASNIFIARCSFQDKIYQINSNNLFYLPSESAYVVIISRASWLKSSIWLPKN